MALGAKTVPADDPGPAARRGTRTAAVAIERAEAVFQALGCSTAEIAALKRQGFLSHERRAMGAAIYKLRFRFAGRQQVRYVGTDRSASEIVRHALQILQHGRRARRQIRMACAAAAWALRRAKRQLAPLVEQAGLKFHGRAIRRPRPPSGTAIQ